MAKCIQNEVSLSLKCVILVIQYFYLSVFTLEKYSTSAGEMCRISEVADLQHHKN